MSRFRRTLRSAARRAGLHVQRLDDGCLLVQRGDPRRRVLRMGDGHLGTDVVVDLERARRDPAMLQKRLAELLLREEVGWVLRATEANLVLDVGANAGQYGRALRAAGYRGRIASFEPVAGPFARLERAAAGDPDWRVYPWALGSEEGTTEINVAPGTMSSMLAASDFGRGWSDRLRRLEPETITVRTLDAVLAEVGAGLDPVRAYLKMDTQGFDLEVFAGARASLPFVVALQSEVACVPIYAGMPRLPEQLTRYEEAGFEAAGMYSVSRDRPTLRVIEFDVVMVRPQEVRRPRA
jgi:FkbM family methyltransferase